MKKAPVKSSPSLKTKSKNTKLVSKRTPKKIEASIKAGAKTFARDFTSTIKQLANE